MRNKKLLGVSEPENSLVQQPPQNIELYHSTHSILDAIINTIGTEVAKIRVKSASGLSAIEPSDGKLLTEYMKALLTYEKQQSDIEKNAELNKKIGTMSNEELLELMKKSIEVPGSSNTSKENSV